MFKQKHRLLLLKGLDSGLVGRFSWYFLGCMCSVDTFTIGTCDRLKQARSPRRRIETQNLQTLLRQRLPTLREVIKV